MELTHSDVRNIIKIIDDASHLDDIELVFAGFRLHVRRGAQGEAPPRAAALAPAPVAQPASPTSRTPKAETAVAANEVVVRAPMLGTFYRASSPGEKPFVEVGQKVKADDNVGVIEVMKLFNTIRAGVDGTVVRIEADNGALVEYDQALVVIARD